MLTRTGVAEMGVRSPWLAYVGQHDAVDRASTLVFVGEPDTTWFVRTDPFAAVNPSLAFHHEVSLPPGETLSAAYRVVIADGARSPDWINQRAGFIVDER